jgi:hypothetical protein
MFTVSSASKKERLKRDALNVFTATPVQGSVVVECNKTMYTVVKMTDGQACIIIDGATAQAIDSDELFESYQLVRTTTVLVMLTWIVRRRRRNVGGNAA